MNVKNYGLVGIGGNVELSKGGPRLKNNSGVVELKNNADSALAVVRGADPVGMTDLATKSYVDRHAAAALAGQMINDVARNYDDSGALTPSTGDIVIVTTVGATWDTLKRLLRYNGSAWEYLFTGGRPDGYTMSATSNVTGGTDTYTGDHVYLWDGSAWSDIGPAAATANYVKSANADLAYNGSSAVLVSSMTGRVTKAIVNVSTAFDGGNGDATLTIGDDGTVDAVAPATAIDLYTVGTYVIDAYVEYAATDVEFYYTVDTGTAATAGACDIELQYGVS